MLNKKRMTSLILGITLTIASIAGLVIFNGLLAPDTVEVFAVSDTLQPGDYLSDQNTFLISVSSSGIDSYLNVENVDQFGNAPVIQTVYPGEFIPLSSLADSGANRDSWRTSAILADSSMTALTIPISVETAPEGIQVGDRIDIILSIGAGNFLAGSFDSSAVEETDLYQLDQDALYRLLGELPDGEMPPVEREPISLPVTKTILSAVRVLQVQYHWTTSPSFDPAEGTSRNRGEAVALVIEVPRVNAESAAFAVHNGVVRIAVIHPNAEYFRTPGTVWEDLISFTHNERNQYLEDLAELIIEQVGGAAAIDNLIEKDKRFQEFLLPDEDAPPEIIETEGIE